MSDSITKAPPSQEARADPLRDLVLRLGQDGQALKGRDPVVNDFVQELVRKVEDPRYLQSQTFRTTVSFALQDMERLQGPITTVPPDLRAEMTERAKTVWGLNNEKLERMVAATPQIGDFKLISDIRELALNTAFTARPNDDKVLVGKIEALEQRLEQQGVKLGRPDAGQAPATNQPEVSAAVTQPPGIRSPGKDEEIGRPTEPKLKEADPATRIPGQEGRSQESPRDQPLAGRGTGLFSMMMASIIRDGAERHAERNREPTPIAERMDKYDSALRQRQDEATIRTAEQSQNAALGAVQAFTTSSAASVLNKINDAAKTDPEGMAGVLAGMREGGKYAELRQQFNSGLAAERGAAAAFDKMTSSLTQYGTDRAAAEAVGAKQGNLAVLSAKFESVDGEIAKATAGVPSKTDGKSVLEDLGDKIVEVLNRAMDNIKAAFARSAPASEARVSAGASPG